MLEINKIHQGDCLELMNNIPNKSIDMILCDLPYGTTQNKWDSIIPLDKLWEQYNRIIKERGVIVLTASQPFTSALVMSNFKIFKYEWIWDKKLSSGHLNAKHQPMKRHESIVVFYNKCGKYYPEMRIGKLRTDSISSNSSNYGKQVPIKRESNLYYPTSILEISNADRTKRLHPTQKPVALFEYLIKTYTNEGDVVLDNCIGSGTTAIACINTNRNFIGIELDEKYCEIARESFAKTISSKNLIPITSNQKKNIMRGIYDYIMSNKTLQSNTSLRSNKSNTKLNDIKDVNDIKIQEEEIVKDE